MATTTKSRQARRKAWNRRMVADSTPVRMSGLTPERISSALTGRMTAYPGASEGRLSPAKAKTFDRWSKK